MDVMVDVIKKWRRKSCIIERHTVSSREGLVAYINGYVAGATNAPADQFKIPSSDEESKEFFSGFDVGTRLDTVNA